MRTEGPPMSPNGASSFHAWWEPPPTGLVAVSAVLEVQNLPSVSSLYFWAMQVDFVSADGTQFGGGHIGLQWNKAHPASRAVNWGGYASQYLGGHVLTGSESELPSANQDPNTRDYMWYPHRAYQLVVARGSEPNSWRGVIADLETHDIVTIREINCEGEFLAAATVWTESFADCDAPSVTVSWSDLRGRLVDGREVGPPQVLASFHPSDRGGCDNTNTVVDHGHIFQTTNTERTTAPDSTLKLAEI
ncbi:MAG: hypothetical protein HKO10_04000 [Acidimicrobiia bacterium]|nr:hypothetical protein [Acidimicrobiia bacterium]